MERSLYDVIAQHKNIIKMIENKEVDQVENVVREHIIEPIKFWENFYKTDSPYARYFDRTEKPVVSQ